ncbi:hypothetical protein A0H81_08160 [Grifola frondosa]|uniref:Uncharacterized protein n=1 Tax=Grifola frondosa TaxID=5627 RepID=A0A1C7M641_GRIFR|nr:hypothetical protein A0H81_08160 [Grifola frondosa]
MKPNFSGNLKVHHCHIFYSNNQSVLLTLMRRGPVELDINTIMAQVHHLPTVFDREAHTSQNVKEAYHGGENTKVVTSSPIPLHYTSGIEIPSWTSLQTKYSGSEDELDLFNTPEEAAEPVGPYRPSYLEFQTLDEHSLRPSTSE